MSHASPLYPSREPLSFDALLDGLEAAGEVTRLRLLGLLCEADLTVSELVAILGQSQPRISRHLKLLVDAGLAERQREGAWAFFRLAEPGGALARDLIARVSADDPTLQSDRARLEVTREGRRRQAAAYFAERAADWDHIRALHAPEERVEAAILDLVGDARIHAILDLGTGTGRMLELIAPLAARAVGVDQSPAMLSLARARLAQSGLRNALLRQGDIYAPPVERDAYDLVVVHQVLHFLDDPSRALREAARTLRPGGRLLVVDFAAHAEEYLREQFAHRRLGFSLEEVAAFLTDAGLVDVETRLVAPKTGESGKLTVAIWLARDPRVIADDMRNVSREFA
jgi:demethylmenaquinone methyltransferase/2-methoxy-6-polyprenyl-1,4-benzoquinol methylase/ArsR family transcriptional regulator